MLNCRASFLHISSCSRKHGISKSTNSHLSVYTFTSTQAFRGNIVQTAVLPSVLNAGDFQRKYDWDGEFVHSGVDSGWHYWIISVSLTHTTAFCNLNTQQFQLLLSPCKAYGTVMWIWDSSLRAGHQCNGGRMYSGVELNCV